MRDHKTVERDDRSQGSREILSITRVYGEMINRKGVERVVRTHKAVEREIRYLQAVEREMRDHKAVERYESSQGSRKRP